MDLASPLRSLTPTLDSAVLEVLAGTESGLSLAAITRLANRGSRQGLALVIDHLVEHGLVTAAPANRGYLYTLNRHHVLADAVLSAARARATVLTRLIEAAAALDPTPIHVSVFGSFARREAGPDSDIDLLVVTADPEPDDRWYAQLRDLGNEVQAWTGNRLEYLSFTTSDLTAVALAEEPIVGSWTSDSVTVLGDPIESLLAQLAPLQARHPA